MMCAPSRAKKTPGSTPPYGSNPAGNGTSPTKTGAAEAAWATDNPPGARMRATTTPNRNTTRSTTRLTERRMASSFQEFRVDAGIMGRALYRGGRGRTSVYLGGGGDRDPLSG